MMYAPYIMRRTQIYLEERQAEALSVRAGRRGVTASHAIREAIDAYLAAPEGDAERRRARWQAALRQSAGLAPDLPDGATYVADLRRADADRLARLRRLGDE
jgi:hypothetical protein